MVLHDSDAAPLDEVLGDHHADSLFFHERVGMLIGRGVQNSERIPYLVCLNWLFRGGNEFEYGLFFVLHPDFQGG